MTERKNYNKYHKFILTNAEFGTESIWKLRKKSFSLVFGFQKGDHQNKREKIDLNVSKLDRDQAFRRINQLYINVKNKNEFESYEALVKSEKNSLFFLLFSKMK